MPDGPGGRWVTEDAAEFMEPVVIPTGGIAIRERGPSFPFTVLASVDDIKTMNRVDGADGLVGAQMSCPQPLYLNGYTLLPSNIPMPCMTGAEGIYGMYGMYGYPPAPPPPPPPPPASWNTDGGGAVGPIPGETYPTGESEATPGPGLVEPPDFGQTFPPTVPVGGRL